MLGSMNEHLKRAAALLVIAFLIYAMFKSPVRSAHVVASAWDGVIAGLQAIGEFFDALLGKR
jgi:hypothetical protein